MATTAAWRPIGTVLVDSGAITEDDLEAALAEQKRSGRRLGEILIGSGAITWLDLAHAIAEQASDLEAGAVEPAPVVQHAEPVKPADADAEKDDRLETVETMLKERQRAFLELVSVTE